MGKLLQNYKRLGYEIFRILLKHVRNHLLLIFQFAWRYLKVILRLQVLGFRIIF